MSEKIRLADYVIQTLADKGIDTAFMVTGGMAMHLNDALALEPRIKKVCCHHEQSCALAAEAYAHVTGKPAFVQVTAGPGAINAITGVFGAHVDGLPMIVISGQVKRETLCASYGLTGTLRQAGEQEANIVGMVRPVTKYAAQILDPSRIRYELEKAFQIAVSGRPGPVWLEIPVDVQGAKVDAESLPSFHTPYVPPADLRGAAKDLLSKIEAAERPMLVVGPGVRLCQSVESVRKLAEKLACPVVCAGTLDVISKESPFYAGAIGNVGNRAGNINVQNADLLLFLGVTMHLTFTTYNWGAMGKRALKIVVEEDAGECERPQYLADQTIQCGTRAFVDSLLLELEMRPLSCAEKWLVFCRERVRLLPAVSEAMRTITEDGRINPYWFAEELFHRLAQGDIVVPGNASAGVIAQQAGSLCGKQRLIANFGNGPMGFAVPASVGAAMAAPDSRVICLDGDGSFMLNMQELATIVHHKLPIVVFIYNNNGYLSIRGTQKNFFGTMLGCDPESGLSFPDFVLLAKAFGMKAFSLQGKNWLEELDAILLERGPLLVNVLLDPDQGFEPKISSKRLPDGRMISLPPEDMFPFLERDELQSHLLFPVENQD